ncbi:MAG: hypothetical protein L0338_28035, partial [Acidobacteria bacterium]|nr:hypothetical protein [Acidobacteriota bacterium]
QFRTNVELLQNPSRAFQVIELARGRTIADVLRSRSLVQGSAPTPVMVQISSLQRRLIESTSRTERKSLVDQIDQAEILMAPETSALWRSRGYLQLADSPVSLEALRKTLSERELILEYVLTEPNSYCLVVSRDNIQIVRPCQWKRNRRQCRALRQGDSGEEGTHIARPTDFQRSDSADPESEVSPHYCPRWKAQQPSVRDASCRA